MIQSKIAKVTALATCMSLLLAIPAYASTGQGSQNNMSNMNNRNNINMNTSMGGINMNMNTSMGGIDIQFQQNGTQNGMQNGTQSASQNNKQLSNAAQYMVNQGIIKGNTSGNYSMADNVKRCDMSLMIVRAFNLTTAPNSSGNNFGDVAQNSYYYAAVNTMKQMGIAQGDGQNFNPTQNMTLQEAILFVQRALDAAGIDYSDVDLEDLFAGKSLSGSATREDVSTILYAVLGEDYTDTATSANAVAYRADEDTSITFDGDDFNDVCADATGETLDYVVFSNPSGTLGKLYYDYTSSSIYDSKVSTSEKYYYDADDGDSLSAVAFVPNTDLSGTVSINYTGYDTDGNSFTGSVKITINAEDEVVADAITYDTDEETAITFDEDDFNDVCTDATGEDLSYVKFTLPSTSYGKLYYNYTSSTDYDDKVASTYKYYYDADDDSLALSGITFVPKDDFSGTAKVNYTGYNTDGETFTGTVKITVE
jgi:hypothetical protein